MTFTPRATAFFSIAAPEPESRSTSSSTFAPFVMACSAWVCCVEALPCALTMLYVSPAFLKAFARNGRSAVSQRVDDCVSGRSTATWTAACLRAVLPAAVATSAASPATSAAAIATAIAFLRGTLLTYSSLVGGGGSTQGSGAGTGYGRGTAGGRVQGIGP